MDKKLDSLGESELRAYLKSLSVKDINAGSGNLEHPENLERFNAVYENMLTLTKELSGRIVNFTLDINKPHGFIGAVFPAFGLEGKNAEIFAETIKLCERMEIMPYQNSGIAVALQVENIFVKEK